MVFENYSLLIIGGSPSEESLKKAWSDIVAEYCELIKTPKTKSIFEAWKKCVYTYWKICFVNAVINKFRMKNEDGIYFYNKSEAEQLMEMGYEFIEECIDEEKYLKQIDVVEMESKNLIVFLNQYRSEYKLLTPDTDDNDAVKQTVQDYDKELAVLSKFMGYWIDKKQRTVSDICAIKNAFIENQNNYAS